MAFSDATRGPDSSVASSSPPSRPGAAKASIIVPEVFTKALPEPMSALPIVSTACKSVDAAAA